MSDSPKEEPVFRYAGEMSCRLRAYPWASTSLGAPQNWPQPLKTFIDLMLSSIQPMFIAWGPKRTLLYNDAYAEVLASKHPSAIACDFLEVWHEIRADLLPIVEQAYAGIPVHMDDIMLVMHRKGYPEETHFSFSYTPVRDESGEVGGFFCPCNDITRHVLAERSLRESETRAKGVLDGMAEGFSLLGPDFTIIDVNAEAMRLESRSREEIVGRTHWEAYPGSEAGELGRLYKKAMIERVAVSLEHFYEWEDGRKAWLDMRAYPTTDGLAVFFRDVTRRKTAEEALHSAAEQAANDAAERNALLSQLGEGVIVADALGRITFVNEAAERLHGVKLLGVSPDEYSETYHLLTEAGEPHPSRMLPLARAVLDQETVIDARWRIRRPDGTEVLAIGNARPVFGSEGSLIGGVLTLRDDTVRSDNEAAVRETEERYRLAARATNDAIWDWHFSTNHVLWNEALGRAYGHSLAEVTATSEWWIGHIHPDDRVRIEASIHAAIDGTAESWTDEYRFRRADGTYADVLDRGHVIRDDAGRGVRMIGAMLDLSERRRAEAALADSEERLRLATEFAEVGFWDVDHVNDILIWPPRVKAMFGISADVPVSIQDFYAGLHPGDRDFATAAYAAAADPERQALYDVEYRTIGKEDGVVRWVAAKGRGIFDDSGRCLRVVGAAIDITLRKKLDQALLELNATLEERVVERTAERDRMWDTSPDLMLIIDFEGVFRRVNTAWTTILGYPPEELVGRHVTDFVIAEDHAATIRAQVQASSGDRSNLENRFRHKDGSTRWISWTAAPAENMTYAVGRDVTAEKERQAQLEAAQEALRQSQKMEAVGQLTGGIAHDFNNMLAVVIGSLDLLGRRIGTGDARAKRHVDAAIDGARRAALLTQRLLAFSRQQPLRPEAVDVNKLVAGMSDLLRHSLGADVQLEIVLAGGAWRAHADPNQLENVLLNLAVNARDAMPDGGRLTIETQNAYLDDRYATAHLGVPAGQYILIAVTDTGTGMPAEVIAKAFDPFYTTKEVGKGTGLGLSQVYGFVKQSGGHVKIYSEVGQGTTVKAYLPRLVGISQDSADDASGQELLLGDAQELILVVEDEPTVRQFSADALAELGYRVLEAEGAATALRLLAAHPEVDLLFTDVVMPEVNGRKLADEARRRRPDLKVLFTTGYTRNAVVHNGVLDPGVELIGKPFTIEELAAKVREILDGQKTETDR